MKKIVIFSLIVMIISTLLIIPISATNSYGPWEYFDLSISNVADDNNYAYYEISYYDNNLALVGSMDVYCNGMIFNKTNNGITIDLSVPANDRLHPSTITTACYNFSITPANNVIKDSYYIRTNSCTWYCKGSTYAQNTIFFSLNGTQNPDLDFSFTGYHLGGEEFAQFSCDINQSKIVTSNTLTPPILRLDGGTIKWPSVNGATSYTIYRNGTIIDSITSTSYTPSVVGHYQVVAANATNTSDLSNTIVINTPTPIIPGDPNITGINTPTISYYNGIIRWDYDPGSTAYEVYRNGEYVGITQSNMWVPDEIGNYRIRSFNGNVNAYGEYSNVVYSNHDDSTNSTALEILNIVFRNLFGFVILFLNSVTLFGSPLWTYLATICSVVLIVVLVKLVKESV